MINKTTDEKTIKTAAVLHNTWNTLCDAWGFINQLAWCSDHSCWLVECQCPERRPARKECDQIVSHITNAMNEIASCDTMKSKPILPANASISGSLIGLGATPTGWTTMDSTTGKTTWEGV